MKTFIALLLVVIAVFVGIIAFTPQKSNEKLRQEEIEKAEQEYYDNLINQNENEIDLNRVYSYETKEKYTNGLSIDKQSFSKIVFKDKEESYSGYLD